MNPRSVLYQLTEIRDHVAVLPGAEVNGQLSRAVARGAARPHRARGADARQRSTTRRSPTLRDEHRRDLSDLLSETYLR